MKRKGVFIITIITVISICFSITGCGPNNDTNSVSTENQSVIDYGDAESFEAALNEGDNLEGKIVQFVARNLYPQSKVGYNVTSGEHLNFASSENPDIKVNDVVTVRVTKVENLLGSWIIHYEKIENAVVGDETIFASSEET